MTTAHYILNKEEERVNRTSETMNQRLRIWKALGWFAFFTYTERDMKPSAEFSARSRWASAYKMARTLGWCNSYAVE